MNKIHFYSVVAFFVIAVSGCVQTEKRIVSPAPERGQQQSQISVPGEDPTGQGVSSGTGATSKPYLDLSSEGIPTMEQAAKDTVTPSLKYFNDRIYEYGRKLERWKELDEQSLALNLSQEDTEQMVRCFRRLQNVLNGYTALQEEILLDRRQSGAGEVQGAVMQSLQKQDIEFLESPCGRLLGASDDKSAGWNRREESADLNQLETLIDRYAANHEYEEVVQVWLQIPTSQIDRVDLQTKLRYGNALMYLHQEEQAAQVYQQIVDQMSASEEQSTDLISLRKVLADLHTASGNYGAAEHQYKTISNDYKMLGVIEEWSKLQLSILERSLKGSPELTEYSSLLRNYLGFIPQKDGYKIVWQAENFLLNYPYSAVSSNVDYIKIRAQEKADRWLDGFMARVDKLVAEKKFQEALELLETVPKDIIDESKRDAIKAKNDELVLGEAVDRETEKLAQVQELQRQWNNGLLLVKAERFDEAIAVFTEMLVTEYAVKAEQKIDEVSLLAAKADRRKAANLFIRYTKTTDLESRKKLLIESRNLLKNILVKYPGIEIAEKVRGNIARVEQEMLSIDPTLVHMADSKSFERMQPPQEPLQINISNEPLPGAQPPIVEQPLRQ